MSEFASLEPEVRERLATRGINPEQSYRAFLAEVRVRPPPALMVAVFGPVLGCGQGKALAEARRHPWRRAA